MAAENQPSCMDEQRLSQCSQETMKGKCVHKEQCLSYPATKLFILTPADSGVPNQMLRLVTKAM